MLRLLPVILCLGALNPDRIEARQIRINRYAVSVQEDQAALAEKAAPYPPSGYRPQGRAFWLPGEVEVEIAAAPIEGSGLGADQVTTTTELPLEEESTSTTDSTGDLSTTTNWDSLDATTTQAPPQVELRSGRAFEKAPYPPAGYRPSRAFRLPTEEDLEAPQSASQGNATDSNADHPVCGVSTDPLKPTPEPGSKDEPDAESVVITANLGPAVVVARAPASIPVAIPLRSQPLMAAPRPRGFAYTTHVEQRW